MKFFFEDLIIQRSVKQVGVNSESLAQKIFLLQLQRLDGIEKEGLVSINY